VRRADARVAASPPPRRDAQQEGDALDEVPPERRDAAPPISTAASPQQGKAARPQLSSIIREGVRAATNAADEPSEPGSEGALPPPRRRLET
jgi:hypothetical protein